MPVGLAGPRPSSRIVKTKAIDPLHGPRQGLEVGISQEAFLRYVLLGNDQEVAAKDIELVEYGTMGRRKLTNIEIGIGREEGIPPGFFLLLFRTFFGVRPRQDPQLKPNSVFFEEFALCRHTLESTAGFSRRHLLDSMPKVSWVNHTSILPEALKPKSPVTQRWSVKAGTPQKGLPKQPPQGISELSATGAYSLPPRLPPPKSFALK